MFRERVTTYLYLKYDLQKPLYFNSAVITPSNGPVQLPKWSRLQNEPQIDPEMIPTLAWKWSPGNYWNRIAYGTWN